MEKVTAYLTFDNQLFISEEKAVLHELTKMLINAFWAIRNANSDGDFLLNLTNHEKTDIMLLHDFKNYLVDYIGTLEKISQGKAL